MKPRKPKAGKVAKAMERVAAIYRQMERERQRHHNKVAGIAVQRDALGGHEDAVLRAALLGKLLHDETEERQRHRDKVADLERRAREARR